MDARKCDICGGFYTKTVWNTVGKGKCCLGTSGTWTDVCPECTAKIQEVIDSRNGINEVPTND